MNLPLILASASPRRRHLLALLRPGFTVVPADVTEADWSHLTPAELCQLNAHLKARAVAKQHPDALVLGADTEVCLGNRVFGKPASMAAAESMLAELAGRTHEVITGVCLLHLRAHREVLFAERTQVTFHPLDTWQIRDYLVRIQPLDKAGAYAIQESGELIVERITGSFTNVVGLPLGRLREELARWAE
jgi:septum formation protein